MKRRIPTNLKGATGVSMQGGTGKNAAKQRKRARVQFAADRAVNRRERAHQEKKRLTQVLGRKPGEPFVPRVRLVKTTRK